MHNSEVTKQLIVQLLSQSSPEPELGARLKQRLSAAFTYAGLGRFDDKAQGYQKFSQFLKQTCGDILYIDRVDESGDIRVSLRAEQPQSALSNTSHSITPQPPTVRNDVWQAFSNPDASRKRFLNRSTGAVCHYREDEQSNARREVEASPDDYVEIEPIQGETQRQWMREFLDTIHLPPKEKPTIEVLVQQPYSSGINATFTRALGDHGPGWRQYRTNQMIGRIRDWTKRNGISFALLRAHSRQPPPGIAKVTNPYAYSSPRKQAIELLATLGDDEIERAILPVLFAAILLRSRV